MNIMQQCLNKAKISGGAKTLKSPENASFSGFGGAKVLKNA